MPSLTTTYDRIIRQPALTMPGNATGSEAACTALTGSQIRAICGLGTTDNVTFNTVTATTSVLTPLLNNTNAAALIIGNSTYGAVVPGVAHFGSPTGTIAKVGTNPATAWSILGDSNSGGWGLDVGGLVAAQYSRLGLWTSGTKWVEIGSTGTATFSGNVKLGSGSLGSGGGIGTGVALSLLYDNYGFGVNSSGVPVVVVNSLQVQTLGSATRVPSSGSYGWTSSGEANQNATTDVQIVRYATGPALEVNAAGGLRVRNLAGSADAAITCGSTTTSGVNRHEHLGTLRRYDSWDGICWASDYEVAWSAYTYANQGPGGDVKFKRYSTGPSFEIDADGGLRVRNYAGSADAPLTASTGTFSGDISMQKTSAQGYIRAYGSDAGGRYTEIYHDDTRGYVKSNFGGLNLNPDGYVRVAEMAAVSSGGQIRIGYNYSTWTVFNGHVNYNAGVRIFAKTTTSQGLGVSGLPGQTSAIFSCDDSGGNQLFSVEPGGGARSWGAYNTKYTQTIHDGTIGILSTSSGALVLSPATSIIGLGGITSSFPAIKRSSTTFAVRLGDDSADAPISCAGITASGAIQETYRTSSLDPTVSDIGSGKRQGWYNTTATEFRDWVNVGGTLYKSTAYT